MNNATNEKFQGAKYDANATAAENAKRIRADVKEAIKAGKLPKGIKVAVRTSTFSMGASIRVAIEEFPGSILNPAHVFAFALNYGTASRSRTSSASPARSKRRSTHSRRSSISISAPNTTPSRTIRT